MEKWTLRCGVYIVIILCYCQENLILLTWLPLTSSGIFSKVWVTQWWNAWSPWADQQLMKKWGHGLALVVSFLQNSWIPFEFSLLECVGDTLLYFSNFPAVIKKGKQTPKLTAVISWSASGGEWVLLPLAQLIFRPGLWIPVTMEIVSPLFL